MALVESVPNVSEGRLLASIDAAAAAMERADGVRLLDRTSDPSHNRSVFTCAGAAARLPAAVRALFEAAVPRIDLRQHSGEHPRIGAVDVVPFVPLAGASMDDCVALARETGAAIAAEFGIPVFLYEEAAERPERRRLEEIRRGGLDGLRARMTSGEWKPDFGPSRPHVTAGATAIGARPPLIAFNVNLATRNVEIAKAIAHRVRASSGGLPHVKALGVSLQHRRLAQVSMNLTNYDVTPVERVFDAVAAAARELGVDVLESELIGLIPEAALAGTTPEHLKLANFAADKILENRLRAAGLIPPA
ncbi:MAG TPA: glutamate formimidoyltransferase [Vicinamibacterales bacterium]|jgi:glutamate formiminotransferase|nr:glutamate formimidoyltransferase [Vicinamibacterales bacterium]